MIYRAGGKAYRLSDRQAADIIALLIKQGHKKAAADIAEQWLRQMTPAKKSNSLFGSILGLADDALAIAGVVSLFDKD